MRGAFIAFWGNRYYPCGGARDKHRDFETLAEASAFCDGIVAEDSCAWAHVAEARTLGIVYEAEYSES